VHRSCAEGNRGRVPVGTQVVCRDETRSLSLSKGHMTGDSSGRYVEAPNTAHSVVGANNHSPPQSHITPHTQVMSIASP
ncbi:MAG: hypothetical protein LBS86_04925, partial [Treponema sp.]|nr:hypothetical protein [Treponema sp.]